MLRTLGQDGVGVFCKLFDQIYNQGVIPEEMCRSVFDHCPIRPKHYYVKNTELLVLMLHLTKVILKVLGKRIKRKIETELNASQFGFQSDCGTRNAVFVLKTSVNDQLKSL